MISTGTYRQAIGACTVTLANGTTVARIPAGKTFTSDYLTIGVPAAAPEALTLHLDIAGLYSGYGTPSQVTMKGMTTTRNVNMVDTSYYGEILDISPKNSTGDQDITNIGTDE